MRDIFVLSLSGGKDSFYLFNFIMQNRNKYPLDYVVHFELDIDYPFIKNVVNYVKDICEQNNIKFISFKPRVSWSELYVLYGFPSRKCRWCNSRYKLDCKKQFNQFCKNNSLNSIFYIGYCYDEFNRYNKRNAINEIYPLVNEKIYEHTILAWARTLPIYNNFYYYFKRCGCMFCPMSSMKEFAYLYKYYNNEFWYFYERLKSTEYALSLRYGKKISLLQSSSKYDSEYLLNTIITKFLPKLEMEEMQLNFFDNKF